MDTKAITPVPPPYGVAPGAWTSMVGKAVGVGENSDVISGVGVSLGGGVSDAIGVWVSVEVDVGGVVLLGVRLGVLVSERLITCCVPAVGVKVIATIVASTSPEINT